MSAQAGFFILCTIALAIVAFRLLSQKKQLEEQHKKEAESLNLRISQLNNEATSSSLKVRHLSAEKDLLQAEINRLTPWVVVADADKKARDLIASATEILNSAKNEASQVMETAKKEASSLLSDTRKKTNASKEQADATLNSAVAQARKIIETAKQRAEEIAGDAYKALNNADLYERTVQAMKNIIEGYGDQYIIPGHSLLDDLAEEFGFTEAGVELKKAREHSKLMIQNGAASTCDYAEKGRKEKSLNFVLDAFNGKVDSILSRVKHDNAGTLEQEIRDSFTLVNFNGKAFRDARVTEEYLSSRLNELKWAAVAQQLKLEERDEQRRIREQIREEEKARREYERAIKEAAKEEEMLLKAMEKVKDQVEKASAEQKEKYLTQLAELSEKLKAAEEKNQRALSMAQQTRSGHVYIISNLGSFGEDVHKIGLTRRLEPLDRIRELGDSSVPFEFDVHALIYSEDAPKLENQLHKHFVMMQLNKVNHRKEFFKVGVSSIREEVEKLGLTAQWTMKAQAREYFETMAIEHAIKDDPAKRDAWTNRQLMIDPVSFDDEAEQAGAFSSALAN